MGSITGSVTKAALGKGLAKTNYGEFAKLNVTVTDEAGKSLVIQKLVKEGNDGQSLIGKRVQVTFKEKEVEGADGDTITLRSTDSKGFVLLDQPSKFGGGGTGGVGIGPSSGTALVGHTPASRSSYSSDGARVGMIIGRAVELAIGRKETSLQGLTSAVADVKSITEALENPTTVKKTKAVELDDEDTSPFN